MKLVRCDSCEKVEPMLLFVESGVRGAKPPTSWSLDDRDGKLYDFCSTICKRAGPKKTVQIPMPKGQMSDNEKLMRRLIDMRAIPSRHGGFIESLARKVTAEDFDLSDKQLKYALDLDDEYGGR